MSYMWLIVASVLSTGVEIPDEGVPTWEGGPQYTTRTEKCPAQINDEATYLKWKWRTNLADPKTGEGRKEDTLMLWSPNVESRSMVAPNAMGRLIFK